MSPRLTARPSDSHRRSWAGSRRLTSEEVVARLVAAARLLPEARAVGINHWCHDDCEATSSGAVRSGLQHISFWPMLLQLPAPVPPQLATHHRCMEDDEFCWRLVGAYGSAALVKLRYMCANDLMWVWRAGACSQQGRRGQRRLRRERPWRWWASGPRRGSLRSRRRRRGGLQGHVRA